jgi:hypothetical protein
MGRETTTRFTPGPWEIRHGSQATDIYGGGKFICEIDCETQVSEANAILIAQAPAMYAELEAVSMYLRDMAKYDPDFMYSTIADFIDGVLAAARGETEKSNNDTI